MADDLIDRIHAAMADVADPKLRALMAEIEARLTRDGPTSLPSAYPTNEPTKEAKQDQRHSPSDYCLRKAIVEENTRDTTHLKDYRPSSGEGYDEAVFLGTGDLDPLGHDALIRR